MLKIIWPVLLMGIVVFFLAYIKMREKIPFKQRDLFEKVMMICIMTFLMVNIAITIKVRRDTAAEINDCIRFYRYFPMTDKDSEFYFVNKWCYNYFDEEEIIRLRGSGVAWFEQQLNTGGKNG